MDNILHMIIGGTQPLELLGLPVSSLPGSAVV